MNLIPVIPYDQASLCEDCRNVVISENARCPICTSQAVTAIRTWLERK